MLQKVGVAIVAALVGAAVALSGVAATHGGAQLGGLSGWSRVHGVVVALPADEVQPDGLGPTFN